MFQRVRKQINPAMILALVALVFAVTGGAFAASGDGGGTGAKATASVTHGHLSASAAKSKAKPKTKAGARGPAGPKGAMGTTGPAGPQGPAGAAGAKGETGAAGANGSNGTDGTDGTSVTSATVSKGAACKEGGSEFKSASATTYACNGEKGKTGTFGGEALPAGKTLTGAYGASGFGEAKFLEPGFGRAATAVSFALPVLWVPPPTGAGGQEPAEPIIHYIKVGEATPEGCTGSVTKPGAVEDNLCVFAEEEENVIGPSPQLSNNAVTSSIGFTLVGFTAAKGQVFFRGTWAVTAG
jgi:hypothetical protein